jgi:ketosteroid isomerase-like protein
MSEENVELVTRWWAGFNKHGLPPFDLCDEQIEIRMPADFPSQEVYRGRDGMRKWRADVFDQDLIEEVRVEVDDLVEAADGETVVMAVRLLAHSKRFETEYELPWAAVWIIREGKLVEAEGYLHMADALEAAGLRE